MVANPDQYIEQDDEPNLEEDTPLRYNYEQAQDHCEDDDYFEQAAGQNKYYSPYHGSVHSYYNDYSATNDQDQENDFYMGRSM